jgi:hypothetical protein
MNVLARIDTSEPASEHAAQIKAFNNIALAFDEAIAELIQEDGDGTALRAAGFTAIADALGHVLPDNRKAALRALQTKGR